MVTDGAMDGDLFVAHTRRVRVPALRPGDIVVMDNLSSHKRVAAVRAIAGAGCAVVYLPPYGPDYNPIELAFAKIKARLRAAELRTVDKIESFFGTAHEAFTPDECGNYIRHAGYTVTHYDPTIDGKASGQCDARRRRLAAFAEVGIPDPVPYRPECQAAVA